ncbi:hypothetical protein LIER_04550 [Lithospermum erythrorhizon]|uniref:Peptidase A2 domain-containing protein n=1 Tax=Lithospermum erythrorhizon TaxID=34254 RepID=A0AAV3P1A4_LITER
MVERILVDTGSSVDILYLNTYDKLLLPRNHIRPIMTRLTGFTGHMVPILTALREIVSPLHLKLKFQTAGGIGEVCGNQKRDRICYQALVRPTSQAVGESGRKRGRKIQLDIKTVRKGEEEDNSPKERENPKRPIPHEEVEEIPFKPTVKELTFKIG